MALKSLGRGAWIDPAVVESVIAFGPKEEFGKKSGPSVTVFCRTSASTWQFETFDKAVEFAAYIVQRLTAPEEPT